MNGIVSSALKAMECGVVILVGTGRTGKTGTAWSILRDEWKETPMAFFRYPPSLLERFDGYRSVRKVSEVRPGEGLFLDDTALYLLSREFASKDSRGFVRWLSVSSHKDVKVLMTVQSLRLLDVLVLEPQDVLLLQKWMSDTALRMERKEYVADLVVGNVMLGEVGAPGEVGGSQAWKAFAWSGRYGDYYEALLPAWWSDAYSKPYRDVDVLAEEVS